LERWLPQHQQARISQLPTLRKEQLWFPHRFPLIAVLELTHS
jgi:hypothetical protein